jgi:PmbA protein
VKEIIEKAAARGATGSEVFLLSSLATSVEFETSRLKNISHTEERGAALRVVADGRIGFATTTRLDDVDRLVDNALATAALGEVADITFAGPSGLASPSIDDRSVRDLSLETMVETATRAVEKVKSYERKMNVETSTTRDVQEITVLTSEGFEGTFSRTIYEHGVGGRLIEGENLLNVWEHRAGSTFGFDHDSMADELIEQVKRGRHNAPVSTGPKTVILTPRALIDVLMTLHLGLNGSAVERGISPLSGKLGETVFDERITIVDDGLMDGGFGSAPFDDEGSAMSRTTLVENGKVASYFTDRRTAERLDHPATGNGLRVKRLVQTKQLSKIPAPEITNWTMPGGDRSLDELTSEIGEGVVVDSIMGILMSNLLAGDFSGNIALGFKIEDGKLVGRVKDAMIAGNIYKLFRDRLVALSSDTKQVGLLGGIGSHVLPYVVLKDVMVSTKTA